MAWTYGNNPTASTLDAVRMAIGDIDTDDQLITDEGINFALSQFSNNIFRAGAFCCRMIAAQFARLANTTFDTISISLSNKHAQYLTMAEVLEGQAKKQGLNAYGIPYVGGVSIDEVNAVRGDTDRMPSAFYTGQFTNPGSTTDEQYVEFGYT